MKTGLLCKMYQILTPEKYREYVKDAPHAQENFSNIRSSWGHMTHRCTNPNNNAYKYYGMKGIKVCQDWLYDVEIFYIWAINNGYKPGLHIDRIDVTNNYCPNNCRWITPSENSKRQKYDYFYKGGCVE